MCRTVIGTVFKHLVWVSLLKKILYFFNIKKNIYCILLDKFSHIWYYNEAYSWNVCRPMQLTSVNIFTYYIYIIHCIMQTMCTMYIRSMTKWLNVHHLMCVQCTSSLVWTIESTDIVPNLLTLCVSMCVCVVHTVYTIQST